MCRLGVDVFGCGHRPVRRIIPCTPINDGQPKPHGEHVFGTVETHRSSGCEVCALKLQTPPPPPPPPSISPTSPTTTTTTNPDAAAAPGTKRASKRLSTLLQRTKSAQSPTSPTTTTTSSSSPPKPPPIKDHYEIPAPVLLYHRDDPKGKTASFKQDLLTETEIEEAMRAYADAVGKAMRCRVDVDEVVACQQHVTSVFHDGKTFEEQLWHLRLANTDCIFDVEGLAERVQRGYLRRLSDSLRGAFGG